MDADGTKYTYMMDTLKAFRDPCHAVFDIVVVILIMGIVTIGLQILRDKGYITNYHFTNIHTA